MIAMGLLAGLFYSFDVAVMPGLTAADDRTLVDAMQQMIDLPAFPLTLLAAPVLAAVALFQARRSRSAKIAGWIIASLALYAVMVVVNFAVHFPLNDELKEQGTRPHRESRRCARRLRDPLGRLEHRPDAGVDGRLRLPCVGARLARTRGASMTPKSQPTPLAMLNVVGMVVAAAGIMIQYVSGVDVPATTCPLDAC